MRYLRLRPIGVILVLLGVTIAVWQKSSYAQHETTVKFGIVNMTPDMSNKRYLPPIFAAAALAGGVGFIVMGARNAKRSPSNERAR